MSIGSVFRSQLARFKHWIAPPDPNQHDYDRILTDLTEKTKQLIEKTSTRAQPQQTSNE